MSNAKMSSLVAGQVVPWVSQMGRVLPADWCIAEWRVVANADGHRTVLLGVMRATGQPLSLTFSKEWSADGSTTAETDEEARTGFDQALQKEVERLKGDAV